MENLRFIDTHTHPYDEAFDADRDVMLQRAISEGVTKWIFPSIDIDSYERLSSLHSQYPSNSFVAMGLHPTSVGPTWKEELAFVEKQLSQNKYIAVGEVGIDAYWSREYLKEQIEVFSAQIDLALKYDLPLIIHQRNALPEMWDLLNSKPHTLKGVFHAFGGSYQTYKIIKKYGDFKLGIGGVVTFKNAAVAQSIENIPLSDILLETDAPWLTPSPYRGERNEISYIPIIAAKIAQIKNIDIEEVAQITTHSAEALFKI